MGITKAADNTCMSLWTVPAALLCGYALLGTAVNAAEMRDSAGYIAFPDARGESLPYLQCVPYARAVSGIRIYGDALTWWEQAEGRYARGNRPKVGAVMSFRPHGRMELGHVAAVSRVVDSRTVLLRHANWSMIEGRRGQIENDVRAVDVSPGNDWSQVRVWYAPIDNLGTTAWPVNGFIYPGKPGMEKSGKPERLAVLASLDGVQKPKAAETPVSRIGADFLRGIRAEVPVRGAPAQRQLAYSGPRPVQAQPARLNPSLADDPIGRIIASRTK